MIRSTGHSRGKLTYGHEDIRLGLHVEVSEELLLSLAHTQCRDRHRGNKICVNDDEKADVSPAREE